MAVDITRHAIDHIGKPEAADSVLVYNRTLKHYTCSMKTMVNESAIQIIDNGVLYMSNNYTIMYT